MSGKQSVQPLGKLLARARKPLADFEKQAVALVFLVFHIQRQGEAVLQFRAKFLNLPVIHAGEPCLKFAHKVLGFGFWGIKGTQQKEQALPQQVARLVHALKHNAKPDRKLGLCPAQAQSKGLIFGADHRGLGNLRRIWRGGFGNGFCASFCANFCTRFYTRFCGSLGGCIILRGGGISLFRAAKHFFNG